MISEITRQQLAELVHDHERPLVICDVDEVVLHFLEDFDEFTRANGFLLDRGSHNWGSNIFCATSGQVASQEQCAELVETYFTTRTRTMRTIEGAVEALHELSGLADVVMLTNLPHHAGDDRRANLRDHGLHFPVITNSGPKGPAINFLASHRKAPVVFVDDSPHFVQSAWDHAPHVTIIHFLQDEKAEANSPVFDFVSLRARTWAEALPHIRETLARI